MKDFLEDYGLVIVTVILMGFIFAGSAVYESYHNEQMMKCKAKFSTEECKELVK